MASDSLRMSTLVVNGILKSNRERPDPARAVLLHQRDDEGRVDAARQERTEIHIGDNLFPYDAVQRSLQFVGRSARVYFTPDSQTLIVTKGTGYLFFQLEPWE